MPAHQTIRMETEPRAKGWRLALISNVREIVFCAGLVLLSGGLALVSWAAALAVPGAVLVWLAIPPRPKA